ncbi:MAG TPA: acyl transferase [Chitinophagaceae bacterium]|nr:acyl transferase [Chitinophagaceae bacterium]
MTIEQMKEQIFTVNERDFESLALDIFKYQAEHIPIYKQYISLLGKEARAISYLEEIPFLPISFFKNNLVCDQPINPDQLPFFQSSGTTSQQNSRHYIIDFELYKSSFRKGFEMFFGKPEQYVILGLLPSYIENGHSSLVYMVNDLIHQSSQAESGFYLYDVEKLSTVIKKLEAEGRKTLLIGVTYALLDFASQFVGQLHHTSIIETGGMKGRREEWTRMEVHAYLKRQFGLSQIFSEYGMTELFSQAYLLKDENFTCPSWMKILIRDLQDPFEITRQGKGALNIIDLANLHSCSFIATDDLGELQLNGQFVVKGRIDRSDIRGCSLLTI